MQLKLKDYNFKPSLARLNNFTNLFTHVVEEQEEGKYLIQILDSTNYDNFFEFEESKHDILIGCGFEIKEIQEDLYIKVLDDSGQDYEYELFDNIDLSENNIIEWYLKEVKSIKF